ncbi:MAG: hypothetical protein LUG24_01195 [Clostridiales bacterium]|nr:hypothetical protein [Clostridiales bacterium]
MDKRSNREQNRANCNKQNSRVEFANELNAEKNSEKNSEKSSNKKADRNCNRSDSE